MMAPSPASSASPLTGSAYAGAGVNEPHSAAPSVHASVASTHLAAGSGGGTRTSVTMTGPGGRILPQLSESWAAPDTSSSVGASGGGGGIAARRFGGGIGGGGLGGLASVHQSAVSFLVSASGGMLTLGDHYHVTSSGVAEFKNPERTRELDLDVNRGALTCRHISELDFDNGFQIGRGSSGRVYNVLHLPTGKRVCVKQMTIDDSHHRDEIKRELDTLHRAPSRWVVDFHGAFFHNDLGVILLVLELMDGSLRDLLNVRTRLTEAEARAITLQAVTGLAQLHEELSCIHRDIKPENLLFDNSGRIKITDFGVSRGSRTADAGSALTFVGSIKYMSPERLEGKAYRYEVDIWSLGILLCEMITGYHPYHDFTMGADQSLTFWDLLQKVMASQGSASSPLEDCVGRMVAAGLGVPDVSADLFDFVKECLAYDRNDRASAGRLLTHPWLAGLSLEDAERTVQQTAFDAARLKDQESRRLAALAAANSSSPRGSTPGGATPSSGGGAGGSGEHGAAATPMRPTPEESRQRSGALMDDFVMSTRSAAQPKR